MPGNPQYLSRICWNSEKWTHPTGEAAKLEDKTWAAREGFGQEEWLFSPRAVASDGRRYAYLTPVDRSRNRLRGEIIDIHLYTISPDRERCYVGILRNAEVLDEETEKHALEQFKESRFLTEMVQQVNEVALDKGYDWTEDDMTFNIRYRPEQVEFCDPLEVVPRNARIYGLPARYRLYPLGEKWRGVVDEWPRRSPAAEPRPTGTQQREGVGPHEADQLHNDIQNLVTRLLRARYGDENVSVEPDFVDVRLTRGNETILIEVKSDNRPRYAIREALGQLLEYAYRSQQQGVSISEMVIVAPGELSELERRYVEDLRTTRQLPVRYLSVTLDNSDIDL